MKNKNDLQPLASFIHGLRIKLKFSQSDIAVVLGIEQSAYHRKESGITRFKLEELKLLAELFHVFVWEFFWIEMGGDDFSEFASSKGFIPQASCQKESTVLHSSVQSLKSEIALL